MTPELTTGEKFIDALERLHKEQTEHIETMNKLMDEKHAHIATITKLQAALAEIDRLEAIIGGDRRCSCGDGFNPECEWKGHHE